MDLWVPAIPNILHWFKRHVIVDLGRLREVVENSRAPAPEIEFFRVCFAAIIRRVSNADPAPVSGLEVTSIQAVKNRYREVDVFAEFVAKARKEIDGMRSLREATRGRRPPARATVIQGDTLSLSSLLGRRAEHLLPFHVVLTSPPYCTAVEYSRRHKLEMFWLGLVQSARDHNRLAHSYIGRGRVRRVERDPAASFPDVGELERTLLRIRTRDPARERALRHYFGSMAQMLAEVSRVLEKRGTFICVTGDSICGRLPVRTSTHIESLAKRHFRVVNRFSYAIRNQYMQYDLRNGGGIRQESVLVLQH